MPNIKAPQYSKILNSKTGVNDPCYTFSIEYTVTDKSLSFVADNEAEINLQNVQKTVLENIEWWNTFISTFLQVSAKHFSKPYTVEQINKITKHTLNGTSTIEFPVQVLLLPASIQISGGVFLVNWQYRCEPMLIDIPVIEPEPDRNKLIGLPDLSKTTDGLEELNMDDVPMDKNATDGVLELDSPTKFYDKQKVKEARLKAKLALYKAQHQLSKYYEKYGNDISDSDSESDDLSDEEDDLSEAEEVQL